MFSRRDSAWLYLMVWILVFLAVDIDSQEPERQLTPMQLFLTGQWHGEQTLSSNVVVQRARRPHGRTKKEPPKLPVTNTDNDDNFSDSDDLTSKVATKRRSRKSDSGHRKQHKRVRPVFRTTSLSPVLDEDVAGETVENVVVETVEQAITRHASGDGRRRLKLKTTTSTTTTSTTTTMTSPAETTAPLDDDEPEPQEIDDVHSDGTTDATTSGNRGPSSTTSSEKTIPTSAAAEQLPDIRVSDMVKQKCVDLIEGPPKVPLDNPYKGKLPKCGEKRYRSFDGNCNNIAFPNRGSVDTVLQRMLEPDYADSLDAPRIANSKLALPSARVISKQVAGNQDVFSPTTTQMFMQFGQFIDHDITNTPRALGKDGGTPTCCVNDSDTTLDPVCFPITIPDDDAFFHPLSQKCMEFTRSMAAIGPGCKGAKREQLNQNTAYIDGSAIYGLDNTRAKALRSKKLGQLKTFLQSATDPHTSLLPRNPTNSECVRPTKVEKCFIAGDVRANVHLGIAQIQTLWLRQHNFVAATLHGLHPNWTDEVLYQEARHFTVAQLQHIAYNEFLPILLGDRIMDKFHLRLLSSGRSSGYNITLHPGIMNEFSAAAYRVGHTMVPNKFSKATKNYKIRDSVPLKSTYFHPFTLYDKDGFDEIIFGMVASAAEEVDSNFVDDLTNHLFEAPGDGFGFDLTALNIQRGRDHGVNGWMKWRGVCGLQTATTFDDLRELDIVPADIVDRMQKFYGDVADIDLYIAGAAEHHVTGGKIGPTFACIIAEQFRRLKFGDRFWYENNLPLSSSLTQEQVDDIRKTTMSRILCDNTPLMETIQLHAFLLPDTSTNPIIRCSEIPGPTFAAAMP